MSTKLIAGAFGLALLASPALAAEQLPLGGPSAATVWGHKVHASSPAQEIEAVALQRPVEAAAPFGAVPSEPTIWGHRPEVVR